MADSSLYGAHISTNLANYEAARSSFFVFQVTGLDKLPRAGKDPDLLNAGTDDTSVDTLSATANDILRLNVVTASVPHFSVAVQEYRRGNDVIKYAGLPSFESGSIKVDDIVGLDTKSILMAWQGLVYNVETRKGGRMGDWTDETGVVHYGYKRDCTLMEYTQDYELIRTWTLYGCWISKISEGEFNKEDANGEKRQLDVTIEFDRAIMEV